MRLRPCLVLALATSASLLLPGCGNSRGPASTNTPVTPVPGVDL